MILLWLVIAFVLDRVLMLISAFSYTCVFTAGYAAIDSVAERREYAPVAYRVLVPWLVRGVERVFPALRKHRLPALYEPIRILSITLALCMIEKAIGVAGTLVVAALLPATFLFDFWDWPFELASFGAALSGDLRWTILLSGVQGFARPMTCMLPGVIYTLVTGDPIGGLIAIVAAYIARFSTRVVVGFHPMVVEWGAMWRANVADLRNLFENRPFYLSEIWMTIALSVGVFIMLATGHGGAAWPIPLALVVIQWLLPRAAETRSMCVCLIWIGAAVTK